MNKEVQGQLSQHCAVMQCKGAAEQSSMAQGMRRAVARRYEHGAGDPWCKAAVLQ